MCCGGVDRFVRQTIRLVGIALVAAVRSVAPKGRGIVTAVQTGSAVGGPDPRPAVVDAGDGTWLLAGACCTACGYPTVAALDRCPVCGEASVPAEFGPGATVFAATVLRIPVPGREPPYALAYVDVDDGPRILAHVDRTDAALVPGARVALVGRTAEGDPLVSETSAGVSP
jgi:uncharacterized OB-fold protein